MSALWVSVVYATASEQFYLQVPFHRGMSVNDAIMQSALAQKIALPEPLQVGIFGVKVALDHLLNAGDRVEIYRPLLINPKDIRRRRAAVHPVGRMKTGNRLKSS